MWSILNKLRRQKPEIPAAPNGQAAVRRWLEAGAAAALGEAAGNLRALMDDPVLGGPGFLTVQLPQRAGEPVSVSCQYPNISEILYRAALGGTAADLAAAGVPPPLLDLGLRWETESGAVVILTLDAAPASGELTDLLTHLRSRNQVLQTLAGEIALRCPGFAVRPLAGYILLTPTPAAPSDPLPSIPGEEPD